MGRWSEGHALLVGYVALICFENCRIVLGNRKGLCLGGKIFRGNIDEELVPAGFVEFRLHIFRIDARIPVEALDDAFSLNLRAGGKSNKLFSQRCVRALGRDDIVHRLTGVVALALAVPAGYALSRLKLPFRSLILLAFLIPQAFPNLPVYVNIARFFYQIGLNGTIMGVVLVHVTHGLVYAVWIATAAFSSVQIDLEEAARSIDAGPLRAFRDVTLPLAAPGLLASAIFVFLESLDEFTGSYFVGAPDVNTLPLLLYTAGSGGNYQIASITALLLLIPSIGFMLVVERFLRADVLSKVGH